VAVGFAAQGGRRRGWAAAQAEFGGEVGAGLLLAF